MLVNHRHSFTSRCPLRLLAHRVAAVSNAVDGRHTHCSTAAVRAADGRRTFALTSSNRQLLNVKVSRLCNHS